MIGEPVANPARGSRATKRLELKCPLWSLGDALLTGLDSPNTGHKERRETGGFQPSLSDHTVRRQSAKHEQRSLAPFSVSLPGRLSARVKDQSETS